MCEHYVVRVCKQCVARALARRGFDLGLRHPSKFRPQSLARFEDTIAKRGLVRSVPYGDCFEMFRLTERNPRSRGRRDPI
jgi:hypothetical protein